MARLKKRKRNCRVCRRVAHPFNQRKRHKLKKRIRGERNSSRQRHQDEQQQEQLDDLNLEFEL